MDEIANFRNDGLGWICKHCSQEQRPEAPSQGLPRHFREGEAESKTPQLAEPSRARWMDRLRRVLVCPKCGVTEEVEKS